MKVKAAVARAHGAPLDLLGLELTDVRADEILVRLVASGVARADIAAIDGQIGIALPFVPGCEGAGIVERVGEDVAGIEAGDAVLVGFDTCGACEACARGDGAACASFAARNLSGQRSDGSPMFLPLPDGTPVQGCFFGQSSFATHLICRGASAVKVANEAPLELLAGLGHDVVRGADAILRGCDLQAGQSLVVFGADAAGLAAVMSARSCGAGLIVVVEASEARRARAEALGAIATVHDVAKAADVMLSLSAEGAACVLETTGSEMARAACHACVAADGIIAFLPPDGVAPLRLTSKEGAGRDAKTMIDRPSLVARLVALQADGGFPLEQIIEFFPFEHVNDALEALRQDRVAKPALRFSLGSFGDLDRALQEGAAIEGPEPPEPEQREPVGDAEGDRSDLVIP